MQHPSSVETARRVASRPLYNEHPYLVTRLVPTLYHVIPLPEAFDEASLVSLARHQWLCNLLPTCLVLAPDDCVYFAANGAETRSDTPARGGIPIAGLLKPARGLSRNSGWTEKNERLLAHVGQRHAHLNGRYLLGDLSKGGRPATAEHRRTLQGTTADGIPRGLTRCLRCGEWKGTCLDQGTGSDEVGARPTFRAELNGDSHRGKGDSPLIVAVSCRCDNDNRCASCYSFLYERKLNANYFREADKQVIHVPGFLACNHRCEP